MEKNDSQKADKKTYDFTRLEIEENIGEFVERDLRKLVGNNIHRQTGDIGMDEISRQIYRDGKAELTVDEVKIIVLYVNSDACTMNIAARQAVTKLLTPNKD